VTLVLNGALRTSIVLPFPILFPTSAPLFTRPETVRCDRCKSFFHMGCVQPPLSAKPTRGYGWTCGPCSRAHEQAVEGHDVRHAPSSAAKPKSHAPPARGRGRPRKDRTLAEKEESVPVRHFKMWPFRYFGSAPPFSLPICHADVIVACWCVQITYRRRRYPW
jgi:PHD-finger